MLLARCNALSLVAMEKANSLFFLLRDRDFVPLLESAQRLGASVYLPSFASGSQLS